MAAVAAAVVEAAAHSLWRKRAVAAGIGFYARGAKLGHLIARDPSMARDSGLLLHRWRKRQQHPAGSSAFYVKAGDQPWWKVKKNAALGRLGPKSRTLRGQ